MTPAVWVRADASDPEWDAFVAGLDGASVFQSAGWAEHRRRSGWRIERWCLSEGGTRAALQLLLRRLPGIVVAWAPGGPIFDPTDADPSVIRGLLDDLLMRLERRHRAMYLRADVPAPPASAVAGALARHLTRPAVRVNTGATVVQALSTDPQALLAAMSKHHRYEVRRGLSQGIEWRSGRGRNEVDALVSLHEEMTRRKRIATAPQARRSAITSLCSSFGEHALVLVGSSGGVPVTACFVLVFAGRAFFHSAATGSRGLRCGASYAAVHMLGLLLAERGVRELDLGGLDARGPMLGVARFKQGFGGRVVTRTGEWHWATRPGLARLADLALRVRRGALAI